MAATPCVVLNVLTQTQLDIMSTLNKKMLALQRTAQLLEENGDAGASFVHQLNNSADTLASITDINSNLYQKLILACPFLGLPPVSTGAFSNVIPTQNVVGAASSVDSLQAAVLQSYNNMVNKLLNHPYNRMTQLQSEMNSTLQRFAADNLLSTDFFRCQQQACGSPLFSDLSPAGIQAQAKEFQQNFVTRKGRVLSQTAQNKADLVTSLVGHLQNLGATVGKPFSSVKAALTASQTA